MHQNTSIKVADLLKKRTPLKEVRFLKCYWSNGAT